MEPETIRTLTAGQGYDLQGDQRGWYGHDPE